jgi:hypothetical protein
MSTETYYPVGGRITVYSYDHHREPIRITATALTDLEGEVRISNWKINTARTEITLTFPDRFGLTDQTYPCEVKETPLPSPGRSFKWADYAGCWIHKKTGIRVKNA